MNKPQFELTRVFADGTKSEPQVVPLAEALAAHTGRRGLLKTGMAASSLLALFSGGCDKQPSSIPAPEPDPPKTTEPPSSIPAPQPDPPDPPKTTVSNWNGKAHRDSVRSVVFSPDGKLLVSGSHDSTIKLWSVPEGALLKTLEGHGSNVYSVAISSNGKLLASGSGGPIKLWSLPEVALLKTLDSVVNSVAISPDGKFLASGSWNQTTKLWSLPEGALLKTLKGHSSGVNSVAISPDGKLLASGSGDKTIKIWSLPEGTLLKTLEGHSEYVRSVAISPNGKLLASGSLDQTIKIWSLPEGTLLKTLKGHSSDVYSVAISPNGNLLASGSGDKTINLWSLSEGPLLKLKTLQGHSDKVQSVAISPDGKLLASGSGDGIIKLWSLPDGNLVAQLVDLAAMSSDEKGATFSGVNSSGQKVTYTLPCGSPIPSGAECTCNCVPGTYYVPRPYIAPSGGGSSSGGSRQICTCVPIYIPSDRAIKENVEDISETDILSRLARVPVQSWNYKDEGTVRHIGPMAQDFAEAFEVGDSDKHIHVGDAIGVALASIRALHRLVLAQQQEILELRQALAATVCISSRKKMI